MLISSLFSIVIPNWWVYAGSVMKNDSLANNSENENEPICLTYGELVMIKLEELLGDFYGPQRSSMPVTQDFWEWRKENKDRPKVLNKAGLVLNKGEDQYGHAVWTADLTNLSADT